MAQPQPVSDPLFDTDQAAEYLGVSPRTLEHWRYQGAPEPGLRFVKVGRSVRYRQSDLDKYLEARTRTSNRPKHADAAGE